MSKKTILVLVCIGIAALAAGFFVFQQIQQGRVQQAYEASPDKIADEYIASLLAGDIKQSMANFSSDLKSNYSESYWKTTIFAEFQGYTGTPTLQDKGPVQPASPDVPNGYDPQLNQQATQFDYVFTNVNYATYQLSLVVFRENNTWKINEIHGGYRS